MKRLFLAVLAVAVFGVRLSAQPRYLVNELDPVDAFCYEEFEYDGASSKPMAMSGGLEWYGGFTLSYDHGTHTPGHVAFELGGEYETLMFVFGSMNTNTGAGGSGADTEPCIFTVHVDGKKVLDEVVYPYGLPERAVLDVRTTIRCSESPRPRCGRPARCPWRRAISRAECRRLRSS